MSLDIQNFDLFAKKTKAPQPLKPITKQVEEAPVIEAAPKETKPLQDLLTETFKTNEVLVETKKEENFTLREDNFAEERTFSQQTTNTRAEDNLSKAKFSTFLPVTSRIPEEDVLELKKIENTIMRNRKKGGNANRERITTNSILRCVIANFLDRANDLDLSNIENEEELANRLEKAFKQKYVKKTLTT